MAFAEANGVLYASAGTSVYRRHDGPKPHWEKIYTDNTPEHWELGGIRGLTAVPAPSGQGESLLFSHTDRIIRVDPADNHRSTIELRIRPLLEKAWGVPVPGAIIAAYSYITPIKDPGSGRTVYLLGVEGRAIVVSPFARHAGRWVYFAGFDCNFFPARDTAWIFCAPIETVLCPGQ